MKYIQWMCSMTLARYSAGLNRVGKWSKVERVEIESGRTKHEESTEEEAQRQTIEV